MIWNILWNFVKSFRKKEEQKEEQKRVLVDLEQKQEQTRTVTKKGKFMKSLYAHVFLFECRHSKSYVRHYYTVSNFSRNPSYELAVDFHNTDYPEHVVIDVHYMYTKELALEDE